MPPPYPAKAPPPASLHSPHSASSRPPLPLPASDSLAGEDSLLGCDLLSQASPHGGQSVSALPSSSSSCSSALLASGPGSCLEEAPSAQRVSGKSSSRLASDAAVCPLLPERIERLQAVPLRPEADGPTEELRRRFHDRMSQSLCRT